MIHTYEIQDQDEIVVITPFGNVRIYAQGSDVDGNYVHIDVDDKPTTTEVQLFIDGDLKGNG